jgi:uncharacterized repeat protein (TIGR01451 family)
LNQNVLDLSHENREVYSDADVGVYITATYTATVTNNGPAAASDVLLAASLPSTGVLVSAAPSIGTCSGTTAVLCHLGTLTKSSSATIVIRVLQTSAGISPIDLMNARRRTGTPGGTAVVSHPPMLCRRPRRVVYDQQQALKPDEVALAARASAAQFLPGVGNK